MAKERRESAQSSAQLAAKLGLADDQNDREVNGKEKEQKEQRVCHCQREQKETEQTLFWFQTELPEKSRSWSHLGSLLNLVGASRLKQPLVTTPFRGARPSYFVGKAAECLEYLPE